MMLLTKANRRALPSIGATSEQADPVVQVKFFCPWGMATWLATEFDGEDLFFGWAVLNDPACAELGYFSLAELQSIRGRFGLGIERDLHFTPCPLSEAKRRLGYESAA